MSAFSFSRHPPARVLQRVLPSSGVSSGERGGAPSPSWLLHRSRGAGRLDAPIPRGLVEKVPAQGVRGRFIGLFAYSPISGGQSICIHSAPGAVCRAAKRPPRSPRARSALQTPSPQARLGWWLRQQGCAELTQPDVAVQGLGQPDEQPANFTITRRVQDARSAPKLGSSGD